MSKYYFYAVDAALKKIGIAINQKNLISVVNDLEAAIEADKRSQEKAVDFILNPKKVSTYHE